MNLAATYTAIRRRLENWNGYQALALALERFRNLQVFLAGGVIRDCLIDTPSPNGDFDFFLQGPSITAAIELLAKHGDLTSTPYGAPRWYPSSSPEQYADLISIEGFIPGLWKCEDIVDVLNQFDFTANAVAFNIRTGECFDPQNGARDALRRTMKMVRFDYPEGPFIERATLSRNAVLWFRILHYAGVLSFTIEPFTLQWLKANRSFNRYEDEFARLFFRPRPDYMDSLNE